MKKIFQKTYRGERILNFVCQVNSTLTSLGNDKRITKGKLYINSLNKSRCKIIFNKIYPNQLISLNICKPINTMNHTNKIKNK